MSDEGNGFRYCWRDQEAKDDGKEVRRKDLSSYVARRAFLVLESPSDPKGKHCKSATVKEIRPCR